MTSKNKHIGLRSKPPHFPCLRTDVVPVAHGQSARPLTLMLCLGGLNGTVAIAAAQGLFITSNAPMLAFAFMSGPGAILTASLLDGPMVDRAITALLAGLIATLIVVGAASFGPSLLRFVNMDVLRIVGAVAIGAIALLIGGVKIPTQMPIVIMIVGLLLSVVWR